MPNADAPKGEAAPKAELPNAALGVVLDPKADWPNAVLPPNAEVGFICGAGVAGVAGTGEPNAAVPKADFVGAGTPGVAG